jgi:hypothetical protein
MLAGDRSRALEREGGPFQCWSAVPVSATCVEGWLVATEQRCGPWSAPRARRPCVSWTYVSDGHPGQQEGDRGAPDCRARERASFSIDTPAGQVRVVRGYPQGRLPVCLYRRDESLEGGTLVREAGAVDVPASQVATWPVPPTCSTTSSRGTTACCHPSDAGPLRRHPRAASITGRGCPRRQPRRGRGLAGDPHRDGRLSDIRRNRDGVYGGDAGGAFGASVLQGPGGSVRRQPARRGALHRSRSLEGGFSTVEAVGSRDEPGQTKLSWAGLTRSSSARRHIGTAWLPTR